MNNAVIDRGADQMVHSTAQVVQRMVGAVTGLACSLQHGKHLQEDRMDAAA